jgi:hypothetical protein
MGCAVSLEANYGHRLIVVSRGDGTPESMLLSVEGIPYIWRVAKNKKYILQKLEEQFRDNLDPKILAML